MTPGVIDPARLHAGVATFETLCFSDGNIVSLCVGMVVTLERDCQVPFCMQRGGFSKGGAGSQRGAASDEGRGLRGRPEGYARRVTARENSNSNVANSTMMVAADSSTGLSASRAVVNISRGRVR